MRTLHERDAVLERLWKQFADIPMNPDTEKMEEPFMDFPAGTAREDIWHWFDERHSKGVVYLLYGRPFYEKDFDEVYLLREFIKQEVLFRLKGSLNIPDGRLSPYIISACVENLYDNSDVMFDYDSMDENLRETLAEYGINPDDYKEVQNGSN